MAKKAKKPAKKVVKKSARRPFTKEDIKALRAHSKARTPVTKIAKQMKRTEGSLRQKAQKLGIGLGHQR
jgi:hypothetical protein